MLKRTKKKIALWCATFSVFFMPLGYDALFKLVMDLTGSYWTADIVFYIMSLILFAGYFYFSDTNPIIAFSKWKKRAKKTIKPKVPWLFKRQIKKKKKT